MNTAARAPSLDETFRIVRVIHIALIAAVFVYLGLCLVLQQQHAGELRTGLLAVFVLMAVWSIAALFGFRAKLLSSSEDTLRRDPSDAKALAKWRAGHLVSMVSAEAVALWGVVTFFMGGTWAYVAPFFAVGLLLLFICTPQKP